MKKIDLRSPAYLGRLARWTRAHASIVEGLYTSPLHPAAQDHTAAVIGEIAAKYAVDGVHLDYVRFPNEDFDYSPAAMEQFKAAIAAGPDRSREARGRRARSARSGRVSESLPRALERLPPLAPDVAGDQDPHRGEDRAARRARQRRRRARRAAWRSTAGCRTGAAGSISRCSTCSARWPTPPRPTIFQKQIAAARAYAGSRPVWAGIGAYQLSPAQTLAHIAAANKLGVAGIILFSYDSLAAPPNSAGSVSELGRAAFGSRIAGVTLRRGVALRGRLPRHRRVSARDHRLRVVVRALSEDHPRLLPDRSQRALVGDLLHDRRHRNQHADVHRHPGAGLRRAT